jgi:hypothetical protein
LWNRLEAGEYAALPLPWLWKDDEEMIIHISPREQILNDKITKLEDRIALLEGVEKERDELKVWRSIDEDTMTKHCKGCVHHHNAGHPKESNKAKTYNDWCCKMGMTARDAIGNCKLNKLKKETP